MSWFFNKPAQGLDAPLTSLAGYFYGPDLEALAPASRLEIISNIAKRLLGRDTRMRVGADGKLYPYGPGAGTKNSEAPIGFQRLNAADIRERQGDNIFPRSYGPR